MGRAACREIHSARCRPVQLARWCRQRNAASDIHAKFVSRIVLRKGQPKPSEQFFAFLEPGRYPLQRAISFWSAKFSLCDAKTSSWKLVPQHSHNFRGSRQTNLLKVAKLNPWRLIETGLEKAAIVPLRCLRRGGFTGDQPTGEARLCHEQTTLVATSPKPDNLQRHFLASVTETNMTERGRSTESPDQDLLSRSDLLTLCVKSIRSNDFSRERSVRICCSSQHFVVLTITICSGLCTENVLDIFVHCDPPGGKTKLFWCVFLLE